MNNRHALALLMNVSRHASFMTCGSACRPPEVVAVHTSTSKAQARPNKGSRPNKGMTAVFSTEYQI